MGVKHKSSKPKVKGPKRKRGLDLEDKIALMEKKANKKHQKLEYAFQIQEARKRKEALKEAGTIHLDEIARALNDWLPLRSVPADPQADVAGLLAGLGVQNRVDDFAWSSNEEPESASDLSSQEGGDEYSEAEELESEYLSADENVIEDEEEEDLDETSSVEDESEEAEGLHRRISFPESTQFLPESRELLQHAMSGNDVIFCSESFHESSVARSSYTMLSAFALSHMLHKSAKVERNNKRFSKNPDTTEDARDQGPNRPRMLWLAPFRANAYEVIRNCLTLLNVEQEALEKGNMKSFLEEYNDQDLRNEHAKNWEDWRRELFKGHYDEPNYDDFVIGVSFNHGRIRLQFPKTSEGLCGVDCIVASPLGLSKIAANDRKSIRVRDMFHHSRSDADRGEEELIEVDNGEDKNNENLLPVMDFLSGIELLVVDRADAMAVQNLENCRDVINTVNQQAIATITADINRIEEKFLNPETAKAARQTIVLAGSVMTEDDYSSLGLRANRTVKMLPQYAGVALIRALKLKIKQQFFIKVPRDSQLDYFRSSFWKDIGNEIKQLIIVVANTSELTPLLEFLDDEGIPKSCCLSEETLSDIGGKRRKQIKATLRAFREGEIRTIVVSERLLWYQRIRITGARHVLFYGCPRTDSVYADILADITDPLRCTSTCVYTTNEARAVERIVGSQKVAKLTDPNMERKITVFTP
jgi:hypothetical protein